MPRPLKALRYVTLKFLVLGAVHAAGDVRPVHSEAYVVACGVAAMTGPAVVTSS
jgi:hypothetical protein